MIGLALSRYSHSLLSLTLYHSPTLSLVVLAYDTSPSQIITEGGTVDEKILFLASYPEETSRKRFFCSPAPSLHKPLPQSQSFTTLLRDVQSFIHNDYPGYHFPSECAHLHPRSPLFYLPHFLRRHFSSPLCRLLPPSHPSSAISAARTIVPRAHTMTSWISYE